MKNATGTFYAQSKSHKRVFESSYKKLSEINHELLRQENIFLLPWNKNTV